MVVFGLKSHPASSLSYFFTRPLMFCVHSHAMHSLFVFTAVQLLTITTCLPQDPLNPAFGPFHPEILSIDPSSDMLAINTKYPGIAIPDSQIDSTLPKTQIDTGVDCTLGGAKIVNKRQKPIWCTPDQAPKSIPEGDPTPNPAEPLPDNPLPVLPLEEVPEVPKIPGITPWPLSDWPGKPQPDNLDFGKKPAKLPEELGPKVGDEGEKNLVFSYQNGDERRCIDKLTLCCWGPPEIPNVNRCRMCRVPIVSTSSCINF